MALNGSRPPRSAIRSQYARVASLRVVRLQILGSTTASHRGRPRLPCHHRDACQGPLSPNFIHSAPGGKIPADARTVKLRALQAEAQASRSSTRAWRARQARPKAVGRLRGRAVVDLAEAEAQGGQPLAVAEELVDRLHQEQDQGREPGVKALGLRLVLGARRSASARRSAPGDGRIRPRGSCRCSPRASRR